MIKEFAMHVFTPAWRAVTCHLCGRDAGQAEPVRLHGEPLTRGQFGYEVHPVLCPCGLVYLNPRWTGACYGEFYTKHYDALYRLETKPDYGTEGVRRHMRQVWERISPVFAARPAPVTVLDAGCGSGYGLQYLQEQLPGIKIFGIEASPDCCRILQDEVKATLLDSDIDGPWLADHQGRFDLIILRHVAEHFLTPVETLQRLRRALAADGLMYIAVPDMMHPRTVLRDYDKWWEYWFRAVHPYYYSRETLFATLARAGLRPLAWGEENEEVWCLVGPGPQAAEYCQDRELRARQAELLRRLLP
jgi:SAM-dependent methyltransferase